LLGDTDEPLTFYCIHDGDGPGTVIYDAMQAGASARPKRRVNIVNLGLEPDEALEMDLDPEPVKRKESKSGKVKQVPVGKYVAPEWRKWLQRHRVELNAMTTPQFIEWLDRKMAPHNTGKVIPPIEVLRQHLADGVRANLEEKITAEILREGRFEQRVTEAAAALEPEIEGRAATLARMVSEALGREPTDPWSAPVAKLAVDVVAGSYPTRPTKGQ
jgi:hypothetical protein